MIAEAFIEVFNRLEIPRSSAFQFADDNESFPHVIDRINVTDKNGRPFVYIIDVGANPDMLFPLTEFTAEYHQPLRGKLPELEFSDPAYSFRPQGPLNGN